MERGGREKKWREEGESSSYLASSRLPHSRTHDVIEIRPELLCVVQQALPACTTSVFVFQSRGNLGTRLDDTCMWYTLNCMTQKRLQSQLEFLTVTL